MMECTHPHQTYYQGHWYCNNCEGLSTPKKRRPLTEHEALKLEWYKSEKKWIDNIQDRKISTDKFGNKVIVSQGKVMPKQPSQYYKNGGRTK